MDVAVGYCVRSPTVREGAATEPDTSGWQAQLTSEVNPLAIASGSVSALDGWAPSLPLWVLTSFRYWHSTDRALSDAAEIEHAFVLDYIRNLGEALWGRIL
jgi:hypothetical protein